MIYELQIMTAADSTFRLEDYREKFSWLDNQGYNIYIEKRPAQSQGVLIYFRILGNPTAEQYKSVDIIYIFKHQIAEVLADHIVREWEQKLTYREVGRKKRHIQLQDRAKVVAKALEFLTNCNGNDSLNLLMNYGRKNKMSHKILEYITQNDYLAIEGFINFCLQDYLAEIKFAVDLACEELKNEREYNEFVKLLRYFVDTQPPMVTEVNIMTERNGRFTLWDGNGTRIEERHLDYYWEDMARGDISLDDVLVSILITVAPRRIILHNTGQEPKNESVKMIRKVFGQRISECHGCERCFNPSSKQEIITLKID